MKIIFYSANIADYDYFYHPKNRDLNVDYYLFTDNKYFKSQYWNIINTKNLNLNQLDSRKIARFIKINSHKVLPKHDISIWLDHCFKFTNINVNSILNDLAFNDLAFNDKMIMCYAHDERRCIYEEAKICIERKLDTKSIIESQISRYKREMFPSNFGLFSTGLMIRKNNSKVHLFNEMWWEEVNNGSGRDQLSQSYASWKSNVKIDPINLGKNIYNSPLLSLKVPHIKVK